MHQETRTDGTSKHGQEVAVVARPLVVDTNPKVFDCGRGGLRVVVTEMMM